MKSDLNYKSYTQLFYFQLKLKMEVKIEGLHWCGCLLKSRFQVSFLKAQNHKFTRESCRTVCLTPLIVLLISYSALVTSKNDELFLSQLNEEIESISQTKISSVESLNWYFQYQCSHPTKKAKAIGGVQIDQAIIYEITVCEKACQLLLRPIWG